MDGIAMLSAEVLKAMAQPTRMKIICFLRNGERSVLDICRGIGEEQSNTSRHLAVLSAHGVLVQHKEGMRVYYGIKHVEILAIVDLVSVMVGREFAVQVDK